MKKEFSNNTIEVFAKTIFHYIPEILKYIDEIKDPRRKFNEKYGSVKVFRRRFYAHLSERNINIELIQTKIQIRFDKSTLTYINYIEER